MENPESRFASWQSGTNSPETMKALNFSGTTKFLQSPDLLRSGIDLGTLGAALYGFKKLVEGARQETK